MHQYHVEDRDRLHERQVIVLHQPRQRTYQFICGVVLALQYVRQRAKTPPQQLGDDRDLRRSQQGCDAHVDTITGAEIPHRVGVIIDQVRAHQNRLIHLQIGVEQEHQTLGVARQMWILRPHVHQYRKQAG